MYTPSTKHFKDKVKNQLRIHLIGEASPDHLVREVQGLLSLCLASLWHGHYPHVFGLRLEIPFSLAKLAERFRDWALDLFTGLKKTRLHLIGRSSINEKPNKLTSKILQIAITSRQGGKWVI